MCALGELALILAELVSLLPCCVLQARWPDGSRLVSCLCLRLIVGVLGLQTDWRPSDCHYKHIYPQGCLLSPVQTLDSHRTKESANRAGTNPRGVLQQMGICLRCCLITFFGGSGRSAE